ncbi:MYG1 family protein [Periweissella cryptocerci]|nr:MYG1 family protein [Periweissella cryptocerci]
MSTQFTDLWTHAGTFHADEVFATAMLLTLQPNAAVHRVNAVPADIDTAADNGAIVYDIGGGRFDHHQRGGNGARENEVSYASAGLIWQHFGAEIIATAQTSADTDLQRVVDNVDKRLIQGLDLQDTGELQDAGVAMTVGTAIANFNPGWDSNDDANTRFDEAVHVAAMILENTINRALGSLKAEVIVKASLATATDGLLVLNRYLPYQGVLFDLADDTILVVVYPSNRGGYNWKVTNVEPHSFEAKILAPENWRGLKDAELQAVTGVATASFVHTAGFIGGAQTLADTIKMAQLIITQNEKPGLA